LVPTVAFVGHHNSGKTTFATKVVKILQDKGYKVGVIKSTKEEVKFNDTPGKDTYCYKKAGAQGICLLNKEEILLYGKFGELKPEYLSSLMFGEFDIVICEGFKSSKLPKFEVYRKELKEPPLFKRLDNLLGVVSDCTFKEVRNFPIDKPQLVAEFIEENFILEEKEEAGLFVNGKKVPMKPFLRGILKEVLLGFLRPLKGIEYPVRELLVKVNQNKND